MKKLSLAVMIGLLILPCLGAQEQKDAQSEIMKNLQIVEKPEAVPSRFKAGFDSITARDMMPLMAFLSSDLLEGRETGSRGYDTAAAYAQSLFALWGLKPGGDLPGPTAGQMPMFGPERSAVKPEPGYLQEFAMKEAVEAAAGVVLETSRSGSGRHYHRANLNNYLEKMPRLGRPGRAPLPGKGRVRPHPPGQWVRASSSSVMAQK